VHLDWPRVEVNVCSTARWWQVRRLKLREGAGPIWAGRRAGGQAGRQALNREADNQALRAVSGLTLIGHWTHESRLTALSLAPNVPTGQSVGVVILVAAQKAPRGQVLQARCPVLSWKVPCGHSRQLGCFWSAKKPALQAVGLTAPLGHWWPGGQVCTGLAGGGEVGPGMACSGQNILGEGRDQPVT
jgi:hypothetical protein